MKLRTKLLCMIMAVMLSVTLLLVILIDYTTESSAMESVKTVLMNQGELAQDILRQYVYQRGGGMEILVTDAEQAAENISSYLSCEVYIIPAIDSATTEYIGTDESTVVERATRIDEVLSGNTVYFIKKGKPRTFYLDIPFRYDGEIMGMIELIKPLTAEDSAHRRVIFNVVLVFSAGFAVIFAAILLIAYNMLRPLEKLREAADKYESGDFSARIGITTDDEIGDLAAAMNHMGRTLEATFRKISDEQAKQKQFIDSVTHEIRTPLTNIMGYSELMTRIDDVAQRKECGSVVKSEGERMLKMLNSLLDMSRMHRYEQYFNFEKAAPAAVYLECIEAMRPKLEAAGFTESHDLQNCPTLIDGERLSQVFRNIIENSIKYSGGNKINCRIVRNLRSGEIQIELSDNGKGIPDNMLESIMEPFVRVDKARSRSLGGAGIGLTMCREIIEKHNGELHFENMRRGGLMARITLPGIPEGEKQ